MKLHALIVAAGSLLGAGAAWSQSLTTQQMQDAQGTRIELHQDYRSDPSGTSSGIATRIERADGTVDVHGREQHQPNPPTRGPGTVTTETTTETRR